MLNLLIGKKRKRQKKGKSILNPKTKEHTTTTATQTPKIDSFRPHPHTAEGDLMRARSKYTTLFPKEPPHTM
jgi:hypothetical protein